MKVTADGTNKVIVSWSAPLTTNGDLKGYTVFMKTNADGDWTEQKTVGPKVTSQPFENLKPFTQVIAAVRAATLPNSEGGGFEGVMSGEQTATTEEDGKANYWFGSLNMTRVITRLFVLLQHH